MGKEMAKFQFDKSTLLGSKDTIRKQLIEFQEKYDVHEMMAGFLYFRSR